ncbi:UbiA family prenyltransferase [Candidatus Bathyarchaeota archaeon]|nr:UbiA family prenyltransferase [Candidatus Bathyarchaeota archaeon]
MGKIYGLFRLIRPINCLMMGLAVLIGELITYFTLLPFEPSLLGFLTAFTLTGTSMIVNDYWDRSVDAINVPERPIPSGLVSVKEALLLAIALSTIGLLSALITNVACFVVAIISLSISIFYNIRGKQMGLIGNFMVSACIAIPLLYGGFIYQSWNVNFERLGLLLFFDLIIFLANTGREIIKGIVDVEGDKIRGIKTVAIRYSPKIASIIGILFFFSAIILSVFPWIYRMVSWIYLPIVAFSDGGFIISSIILWKNYSKENVIKVKNMILIWMIIGLLAFAIGGLGRGII